ncbi:MAG: N-terminal cleavage protein [Phycisphaerales bacterium]|nr:N-terminal cleavage protein [Phycisphaerales bacterium]
MSTQRKSAFTLVELLVVIGIIAVLISILLPSLNKARAMARTAVCMSNLRVLGQATAMYVNEKKGFLPYPTTTFGEESLWYNCLDRYLAGREDKSRTGVAAGRMYTPYKQCVVWNSFDGNRTGQGQDGLREYAKTYKWNSNLRHNNPYSYAKITEVPQSSNFVMIADGISLDQVGNIISQYDSGQLSIGINDQNDTGVAVRHNGGANICFVDGHAENVRLKTFKNRLTNDPKSLVDRWEGEYVNAAGALVNPSTLANYKTLGISQLGLTRNPNMPLVWSVVGKLYR